jgi:hypothetical protein
MVAAYAMRAVSQLYGFALYEINKESKDEKTLLKAKYFPD